MTRCVMHVKRDEFGVRLNLMSGSRSGFWVLEIKRSGPTKSVLAGGVVAAVTSGMESFILHPTLVGDCHVLGQWQSLHLLLHRDAHVRWFILVPETVAAEWHELPVSLRDQLLVASTVLGSLLKDDFACNKVNIAAIGNLVPQFHFHVIGRWRNDPYWPGVVWGRSTPGRLYAAGEVEAARDRVIKALEEAASTP